MRINVNSLDKFDNTNDNFEKFTKKQSNTTQPTKKSKPKHKDKNRSSFDE